MLQSLKRKWYYYWYVHNVLFTCIMWLGLKDHLNVRSMETDVGRFCTSITATSGIYTSTYCCSGIGLTSTNLITIFWPHHQDLKASFIGRVMFNIGTHKMYSQLNRAPPRSPFTLDESSVPTLNRHSLASTVPPKSPHNDQHLRQ